MATPRSRIQAASEGSMKGYLVSSMFRALFSFLRGVSLDGGGGGAGGWVEGQ